MSEFHLSWPEHRLTLDDPGQVVAQLVELDGRFAAEQRNVLVGLDAPGGSLDLGLGGLHTVVMITTQDDPGLVSLGTSASDEEVRFEFDGDQISFPAATLVAREEVLAAVEEFLATHEQPACITWQEF